jgi:hypothetical protein
MMPLILRRPNVSRKGGSWQDDNYDGFDDDRDTTRNVPSGIALRFRR